MKLILTSIALLCASTGVLVGADVEVSLDSTNGTSAFVVYDADTVEATRIGSDGSVRMRGFEIIPKYYTGSLYDPHLIGGAYHTCDAGFGVAIGGGSYNTVQSGANESVIGGGNNNFVLTNSNHGVIGGGGLNVIGPQASFSTIGGGYENDIRTASPYGTVAGGVGNEIWLSSAASVGGGSGNEIHPGSTAATIGGGFINEIFDTAEYATVGGGYDNEIGVMSLYGTLGGGAANVIERENWGCVIAGGVGNRIHTNSASTFIGGGHTNTIGPNATGATIGGGTGNRIGERSERSTIGGGANNAVGDDCIRATVSGGWGNDIGNWSYYSTVGGGFNNTIDNACSSAIIAGGNDNKIGFASGNAMIPGGAYCNVASNSPYAFAAGRRAHADHAGAFVWADSQDAYFHSQTQDQFCVRASGGVRIDTAQACGIALNTADRPMITRLHDPFTSGSHVGAGRWGLFMEPHTLVLGMPAIGAKTVRIAKYNADSSYTALMTVDQGGNVTATSFNPTSDRASKRDFRDIDSRAVLERLSHIPIQTWCYKEDAANIRHMGPTAQDFHAAYGLGADDRHINTADADGVALSAIQALYEIIKSKDAQIEAMEERLARLEAAISP
jgi:hypothetical protein